MPKKRSQRPTIDDLMDLVEEEFASEEKLHEVVRMCFLSTAKNTAKIKAELEELRLMVRELIDRIESS